ncbi:histidyl-tRNA synthetase [Jimgerdemannia flammicorona]|uniref:Histidyl-tRNA synthetase n=1 Tax=Jimgerdemannia flammicorona TaxID=994334 RepID=A0A433D6I2_9FUNG|nr:histidyl-tRNA synthetase [Jimgerdemannia flammicorona]
MVEIADVLIAQIKEQGDKIHTLKTQKADKHIINAEVLVHNDLKQQLVMLKASQLPTGDNAEKKEKEGNGLFALKVPKGTKDYNDMEMAICEKVFSTITSVFKRHGAVTIDTPLFELKGSYDEDRKLIYNLKDQGGEDDPLNLNLSQYVPTNYADFAPAPPRSSGTLRPLPRHEWQGIPELQALPHYQSAPPRPVGDDFDIAGTYDPMEPDAEILRILCEALTALDVGKYTVKINHRKILDGILEVCGVPVDKIRPISSAICKLDKLSWEDVRKEMTEKGLSTESADAIGEYVKLKGVHDLLNHLVADRKLVVNPSAKKGLDDMALLFRYLEIQGVVDKISFDLSLARELDCYTGIIYEAVTEKSAPPRAGSIAAGGRYNELVGMLSGKNKNGEANLRIPCVGVSISVERVFIILLEKYRTEEIKRNEERIAVATEAEYVFKVKPNPQNQIDACDQHPANAAHILPPATNSEELRSWWSKFLERFGSCMVCLLAIVT